jgi:hypothetical protein
MRTGGTWRRLKIAAEVRLGHGVPSALPEAELVRLLGLLALIRDGQGKAAVEDEALQSKAGEQERERTRPSDLKEACKRLAGTVDVRPFL